MNKVAKLLSSAVCLFLMADGVGAQTLTESFHQTPMPKALKTLNEQLDSVKISFIYDKLEDYMVTADVSEVSPVQAVLEIVGFYPLRVAMSENGRMIVVEPQTETRNKLIGILLDNDGRPVEYANIRLFDTATNAFITGGVSNSDGYFVVPTDKANVRMEVSGLGYEKLSTEVAVGNLGKVHLHRAAKQLSEVTVVESGVKFRNNCLEIVPSITQTKHSYNMFSLLAMQPMPGIYVDEAQRTITTMGGKLLILVDGIKRDQNFLFQLRPTNVARMEYYSVVPPRYAGENAAAVLNIVMKTPKEGGTFFAEPSSALWVGNADIPLGFTYNQGLSQFAFRYTLNWRDYQKKYSEEEESYIAPDLGWI